MSNNFNNVHVGTITNSIAAQNTMTGFTANGHNGPGEYSSIWWLFNNLAYNNSEHGYFFTWTWQIADVLKNNIAYRNSGIVEDWGQTNGEHNNWIESHNTWNALGLWPYQPGGGYLNISISDSDFESLDVSQLMLPRKADGSLPDITFGHLRADSDLIDKGINVGLNYSGSAPDIGAFEYS
jgi:hypothetical protein